LLIQAGSIDWGRITTKTMQLEWIDWLVVIAYGIVTLVVGLFSAAARVAASSLFPVGAQVTLVAARHFDGGYHLFHRHTEPRDQPGAYQAFTFIWAITRGPVHDYADDSELRIAVGQKLLNLVADGVTDPIRLRQLTIESLSLPDY
jgi:hypothetical protein